MKKVEQFFISIFLVFQTNLFSQSPDVQQIINSVNIDSLVQLVRELTGEVPTIINDTLQIIASRHSYQPGNALAEAYIKQKLESYELNTFIQPFSSYGNNVIAIQPGLIFPNRKFIICAHYDNMPPGPIAPGADDNASGTAAVIEAARILSQYSFPFTIIYALWDEEEQGLLGSCYYAGEAVSTGDSILGVINMDMIAYDTNGDDIFNIHNRAVGTSILLFNKIIKVNTKYGINLNLVSCNPGSINSDHACFWYYGYGAVMMIEDGYNFNQYYHTVNDLLQYFNLGYYKKAAQLAISSLADLLLNYFYGNIFPENSFIDKTYARLNIDSVKFRSKITNFYGHQFVPTLVYTNSDNSQTDSAMLYDDGLHWDLLANDGIYGGFVPPMQNENFYFVSTNIIDNETNEFISSPYLCSFTTAGPLKVDSIRYVKGITNYYNLRPFIRNEGNTFTVSGARVKLKCDDPWVSGVAGAIDLPTLLPGTSVGASSWIALSYYDSIFPGYFNIKVEVSVDSWTYWMDSLRLNVITGIEGEETMRTAFNLEQNYPNPFNPTTTIGFGIPEKGNVRLSILNILGEEIKILLKEEKEAGYHSIDFNASNLPSGVYFYQLRATPSGGQAGAFVETRKMILLR